MSARITIKRNGNKNLLPKYDIVTSSGDTECLIGECVNAGLGWFVGIDDKEFHALTLKEAKQLATNAYKVA